MAVWQCGLCSHGYDENQAKTSWDELPGDWTCPVCGSPKSSFSKLIPKPAESSPTAPPTSPPRSYQCGLCSYRYDESLEEIPWSCLADDWSCPVCGSGRNAFCCLGTEIQPPKPKTAEEQMEYLAEWRRPADDLEIHMADIHQLAASGKSVIEPMRARIPTFSWDEILIKGAQLAKRPLNKSQPVTTRTVIGPRADCPLVIETPLLVSHMSFGALSREAKLALAQGSAQAETAMSSGEGGILPEALRTAHKYIFEYVPNKYSVTDEYLQQVDAVEIKIGQSAKPGMGGHLPGYKVTREIAAIRGAREGQDLISPANFPDIQNEAELKRTIDELRERTGGKPIGLKLAAGHLQADIKIALAAGIDFLTIDGRAGGTGASPKVVKNAASVPTIFALAKARRVLNQLNAEGVSLIITGGLRVSSDFAKALALGADAIALGTAAMMALGCQQYRICHTGKCPVGIATQDPALRSRLDVDESVRRVANFFKVCTEELKDFARLSGNNDVHSLSIADLCTTNSEISNHTGVEHA